MKTSQRNIFVMSSTLKQLSDDWPKELALFEPILGGILRTKQQQYPLSLGEITILAFFGFVLCDRVLAVLFLGLLV
jgi:hypothetical protein